MIPCVEASWHFLHCAGYLTLTDRATVSPAASTQEATVTNTVSFSSIGALVKKSGIRSKEPSDLSMISKTIRADPCSSFNDYWSLELGSG